MNDQILEERKKEFSHCKLIYKLGNTSNLLRNREVYASKLRKENRKNTIKEKRGIINTYENTEIPEDVKKTSVKMGIDLNNDNVLFFGLSRNQY